MNKHRQGSLPSLSQNKSEHLLSNIITNWNSFENLNSNSKNNLKSPAGSLNEIKIDEDMWIEDIRQKHFNITCKQVFYLLFTSLNNFKTSI